MVPGILFALLSGLCNGLFTTPMKLVPRWKWENIWLVFIVTSCIVAPVAVVASTVPDVSKVFWAAPAGAVKAAAAFGFAWGFGAILFGLAVDRLGVSLANSLVIGLSSALGSLVPLILGGRLRLDLSQAVLFAGVAAFIAGVAVCGSAGRRRESKPAPGTDGPHSLWTGYLIAGGAGVMSAVFNVGYSLALPIADAGERMGYSRFLATNCIWLLMLGAGSIPNVAYCSALAVRHRSGRLFVSKQPARAWVLSVLMGVLWGASIFLYGAATPLLGDIGPSIGWPLSLAMGLVTANVMGFLLKEWQAAGAEAVRLMGRGILILLAAIVLCALSSAVGT